MWNPFNFSGKRYIVTGTTSGIGKATAIRLSEQGAEVCLLGRNEEALRETRKLMQGEGHTIVSIDLAQDDLKLEEIMDAVCADGKKLDGLVYSAGVAPLYPLNSITREKICQCMNVNTYAFVEMVRYITKRKYRADEMSIAVVSSIAAVQPGKCQTIYAMSKASLNAAVYSLAQELADKHIRINSICPGITKTRMSDQAVEKGVHTSENQWMKILTSEQITNGLLFLLSDMSSAMTGRALLLDGGQFL